jgi:hypothetical protein
MEDQTIGVQPVEVPVPVSQVAETVSAAVASINEEASPNLDTTQLMKYLEAIDWKLWEMLKMMKADREEDK